MTRQELRAIRKAKRFTQPRMAAWLEISVRTYKAWELGEAPIPKMARLSMQVFASKP